MNKEQQVTYVTAQRVNTNQIQVKVDGQGGNKIIHPLQSIKGINPSGEGMVVVMDNQPLVYLEDLNYYAAWAKVIDDLTTFLNTIIKGPVALTAQGPANAAPELIQNAQQMITDLKELKQKLP